MSTDDNNSTAQGRVFVSYSRIDKEFVKKLHEGLVAHNLDTWVDWEGIPLSADWWAEIQQAIEGSDNFIFVISPDSLNSKVCGDEVEAALATNKRLVPILHREPNKGDPMHEKIAATNWVYMREQDDFEAVMPQLVETINTDLEHIQQHTRLLKRAIEWDSHNRQNSFTLRGVDLQNAESWLGQASGRTDSIPTPLHVDYIQASRADATRRQRYILGGVSAALVLTIFLAIFAFRQQALAVQAAKEANAGRLAAIAEGLMDDNPVQAALIALESQKIMTTTLYEELIQEIPYLYPPVERVLEHDTAVSGTSWSPNNSRIATASGHTITIWSAHTGGEIATLSASDVAINSVTWHPDNVLLAAALADGSIQIWDTESNEVINTLTGHDEAATFVAWHPEGNQLASASEDSTVKIWDVESDMLTATLAGHSNTVNHIAWNPVRNQLASASDDFTVIIWNLNSNSPVFTLDGHTSWVRSVSWHPGGLHLASASFDTNIIIWEIETGTAIERLQEHLIPVNSVSWSPDGQQLASASDDQTIIIWDGLRNESLYTLRGHTDSVQQIVWEANGDHLVSASDDGSAMIWNTAGNRPSTTFDEHSGIVRTVRWSPDGSKLASGSIDTDIVLWDLTNGRSTSRLRDHTGWVNGLSWHPDGVQLASASSDQRVIVWDTATSHPIHVLEGHTSFVFDVAWHP